MSSDLENKHMWLEKSKKETGTGTLSLEDREDSSEGVKRGD